MLRTRQACAAATFPVTARQVASASIVNQSVDQGYREMLLPTLRVDRAIRRYTRLVPILDTTLDRENAWRNTHNVGRKIKSEGVN